MADRLPNEQLGWVAVIPPAEAAFQLAAAPALVFDGSAVYGGGSVELAVSVSIGMSAQAKAPLADVELAVSPSLAFAAAEVYGADMTLAVAPQLSLTASEHYEASMQLATSASIGISAAEGGRLFEASMTLAVSATLTIDAVEGGRRYEADFGLAVSPTLSLDAGEHYERAMNLAVSPSIGLLSAAVSAASYALTLSPSVGMAGEAVPQAAFALGVSPSIGATAAAVPGASITLSASPTMQFAAAEHYSAAMTLSVSATVGVSGEGITASFVTRDPATGWLMFEGSQYRFAGPNVPGICLSESPSGASYYGGTVVSGLRWPVHAEIDATLADAVAMNARVIRCWAVETIDHPLAIEPSLGVFNEDAFEPVDYLFKRCSELGLKMILPLVDNHTYYMGGKLDYCTWNGVSTANGGANFYTNATVVNSFKNHIAHVLDHVNQYTGIAYKNDPAVLYWETGNELDMGGGVAVPEAWTIDIAQFIKVTKGARQLVGDGSLLSYSSPQTTVLASEYVDVFGNHPYGGLGPKRCMELADLAASYGKAYCNNEFTWNDAAAGGAVNDWKLSDFLSAMEYNRNNAGDLYWQLLPTGVTHGDGFMVHWPGDNYDMASRAKSLADHAAFMASGQVRKTLLCAQSSSATTSNDRWLDFLSAYWAPQAGDVVAMLCGSTGSTGCVDKSPYWINPLGPAEEILVGALSAYFFYHVVSYAEEVAGTLHYEATDVQATQNGCAVGLVLRGIDPINPIDAVATAFNNVGNANPFTFPALNGADLLNNSVVIAGVVKDETGLPYSPVGWARAGWSDTYQGAWIGIKNTRAVAGQTIPATDVPTPSSDEYASIAVAFKEADPVPPSTVQYVSSAVIGGGPLSGTYAMPTHQAGDMIICQVTNTTGGNIPVLPAGWTSKDTRSAGSVGSQLIYKVAASASETLTIPGGDTPETLSIGVYRGVSALGAVANYNSYGQTDIRYPTVALEDPRGVSWVAFTGSHSDGAGLMPAPAGAVQRAFQGGPGFGGGSAGDKAVVHDTNGGVRGFIETSTNGTGSSTQYAHTYAVELKTQ